MIEAVKLRSLTIIAPDFNEREVIGTFISVLQTELTKLAYRYRANILLVVDRCTDGTEDVVAELCRSDPSISAIFLSKRFGHQNSLMAGIDHCATELCLMMDSDLQHPPALIPEMLALIEQGCDIVQTIRVDKLTSPLRKFFSSLFYSFMKRITDVHITPAGADFRLITRKVTKVLQRDIRERNLFLRGMIGWLGFNTSYLQFEVHKRAAGGSKYSWRRLLKFAVMGIISFSNKPLKLAMWIGFIFSSLAFLLTAYFIAIWLLHDTLPSGWATLATMLSLFSGVQLLFLGVLGEYLGFIFEEVKGRPRYVVDRALNLPICPTD